MWDKKIDNIVIPLLSKIFWYQNISETQKGSPTMFFGDMGQKTSTTKRDNPLLIHKLFPYWNFSERQKRSQTNFFGTVRLKVLHGKSWNSPIIHEYFGCPNFFESLEDSPQVFWHCEEKTIDGIVIPPLSINFWNKNNSETQTGSPAMILDDVRQKNWQKCDTPIIYNIAIPEHFWNTEGFAHDVFRHFGTKNLRRQNVTTLFLSINFFRTRTFLKDKSVPPRSFSVLWD